MARYVQINSFPDRSTGNVMREVQEEHRALGDECWTMWGRGRKPKGDHEYKFSSMIGICVDAILTRLFGKAGFYSKAATKRLTKMLDSIDPDVVHIHNLHGYYVNIPMLFEWLEKHRCHVNMTLHDCWTFTGHCAYFTYAKCNQWRSGCGKKAKCPQLATYPKTFSESSCKWNFENKKHIFTMLPSDRMSIIVPSQWLGTLAKCSFLNKYPISVRENRIDESIFRNTPSSFRARNGIDERFMILGIASEWTSRKGLDDFLRLARELGPERYSVVLIGLTAKQIKRIPQEIVALGRTESTKELAEIYSAADVFFNPTREDNYPTVNLEAEACGTPVVTYDVGGCRETISLPQSYLAKNYHAAKERIIRMERLKLS